MGFGDVWHYPRKDLSEAMFTTLISGGTKAVLLFGARRTGKTQYLLHDLAGRAVQYGHRFAYVSFWQESDPLELLGYELEQARNAETYLGRIGQWVSRSKKEVAFGASAGVVEGEARLASADASPSNSGVTALSERLDALQNAQKPTILMLDEFQAVARGANGSEVLQTLYSLLEARQAGIKAVFAGSSMHELSAIFSSSKTRARTNSPFSGFGTRVPLPALEDKFVSFQLDAAQKVYQRRVANAEDAQDVFLRFNRNPEIFRSWILKLGMQPHLGPSSAVDQIFDDFAEMGAFERVFSMPSARRKDTRLRRQVVLRMLAEGVREPTGTAGLTRFEALTGQAPPSANSLNNTLKDLRAADLVDHDSKRNVVSDPVFAQWIARLPMDRFQAG